MDRGPGDRGGAGGGRWGRVEAVQLLALAEKLLDARDLVGSRKFAERAIESEPLLDGAERVLAAADVLLASQRRRINNHVDWYAVLQLDAPPSDGGCDISDVRAQYRRLALALRPVGHHPSPSSAVGEAFKLVSDAWTVLSDPTKKELYDKELAIAAAAHLIPNDDSDGGRHGGEDAADGGFSGAEEVDDDGSFWTACTNCCHVHQYERGYEGRSLLCANCREGFLATELASPPPIVPGSDMYYCAWGLFPLGFPGGPNFGSPLNTARGPEVWRDATGKPCNQTFFPGFSSRRAPWGAQGPAAMDGCVNGEHVKSGSAGKRQKQGDLGVSGNQSFSPTKPHAATMNEKDSQMDKRKKVIAKRPKKQVGGAVELGAAASGEADMALSSANKGDTSIGQQFAAKPGGGNNAQNVGCSRTVEISAEDLDLNFSIDMDAADNIFNSLSTFPYLKDGEIVVID